MLEIRLASVHNATSRRRRRWRVGVVLTGSRASITTVPALLEPIFGWKNIARSMVLRLR